MRAPSWQVRIERAGQLGGQHPCAAEVLRFYQTITGFQKGLCESLPRLRGVSLRDEPQWALLLPEFPELLALVESIGTDALARASRALLRESWKRMRDVLAGYWRGDPLNPQEDFLARVLVQPYLERVASGMDADCSEYHLPVCPLCDGKPLVAVVRPDVSRARRSLVCAFCSTEWGFDRMVCASCGEEAVEKLPVFTPGGFQHVRVEACDSCRRYLKTVDLTRERRAVPIVDELATVALSLWAQEQGYRKVQPNLLGI